MATLNLVNLVIAAVESGIAYNSFTETKKNEIATELGAGSGDKTKAALQNFKRCDERIAAVKDEKTPDSVKRLLGTVSQLQAEQLDILRTWAKGSVYDKLFRPAQVEHAKGADAWQVWCANARRDASGVADTLADDIRKMLTGLSDEHIRAALADEKIGKSIRAFKMPEPKPAENKPA